MPVFIAKGLAGKILDALDKIGAISIIDGSQDAHF
jgi:hypothetical protein